MFFRPSVHNSCVVCHRFCGTEVLKCCYPWLLEQHFCRNPWGSTHVWHINRPYKYFTTSACAKQSLHQHNQLKNRDHFLFMLGGYSIQTEWVLVQEKQSWYIFMAMVCLTSISCALWELVQCNYNPDTQHSWQKGRRAFLGLCGCCVQSLYTQR